MLPDTPVTHLCDSYGVLLRRDAVRHGVDDVALGRLVRRQVLVRLRHGAYCLRAVYLAADDAGRHLILVRAVMRRYDDHVAVSHGSSCVKHGGPTYGLDLSQVRVTHLAGGGRPTARLRHHVGGCRVVDLRRVDGHWATVPARAVLEVATTDGAEAALVQANFFLHRGDFDLATLRMFFAAQQLWPGSLRHHPVLHLADGRIESVGESRCVYAFFTQGLPAPEPQFEICGPGGVLVARVDFAWPELGVVVEFDGREKYHRFRREGETVADMVLREKAREDAIREVTGWTVIRMTWADLERPVGLSARIRAAFRTTAA
ncbi:type IV toxin-antitoxin system AbiEi family antitoxin domain-containing protein [Nocardioides litoris]|uniref:type IV toxin-antitoxin system AbiEi family antitoxin domain-containing protein n=1 Tax=Nocardioides litoris TaxID=1926648 RepID=UPI00111E5C04|nr:type IV toxin-antitoxin system AbiEi family antitoxin domain-containing protein [Nocardioides litoris]